MDLLFRRYASPFLLLNGYIRSGRLAEFVDEFFILHNESEMWNVWLHKVEDKSYRAFKEECEASSKQYMTDEQLETTINESREIMLNFNPNERGE